MWPSRDRAKADLRLPSKLKALTTTRLSTRKSWTTQINRSGRWGWEKYWR